MVKVSFAHGLMYLHVNLPVAEYDLLSWQIYTTGRQNPDMRIGYVSDMRIYLHFPDGSSILFDDKNHEMILFLQDIQIIIRRGDMAQKKE